MKTGPLVLVCWLILMIIGYMFAEVAKFRAYSRRKDLPFEYKFSRLVRRLALGGLMILSLLLLIYTSMNKLSKSGQTNVIVGFISIFLVFIFLAIADLRDTRREYLEARKLLRQRIEHDVDRIVSSAHDVDKGKNKN